MIAGSFYTGIKESNNMTIDVHGVNCNNKQVNDKEK